MRNFIFIRSFESKHQDICLFIEIKHSDLTNTVLCLYNDRRALPIRVFEIEGGGLSKKLKSMRTQLRPLTKEYIALIRFLEK